MKDKVNNYAVSNDGKYLYITLLKNGNTYYTDYSEGIDRIMKSGIFNSGNTNKKDGYLKFIYRCNNRPVNIYFHHIVYCYHYRGLTTENYISVLDSFKNELKNSERKIINCVDHLQPDLRNNCIFNLSLMSFSENLRKEAVERRFKDIFKIVSSHDGKYYRVQFTYITKPKLRQKEIKTLKYYCCTAESLNHLYRYLKAKKWQIRADREGEKINSNIYCIVDKYLCVPRIKAHYHDRDIQKQILALSLDNFTEWN